MAKNYTFSEAVEIIAKGTDMEAIQDLGRRYPILTHKTATVAAKAGEDFVELMSYMPEYLTANKVNTGIKKAVFGDGNDTDTDGDENVQDDGDDTEEAGGKDYESMSAKQLWEILGKAGLRKTAKSTKKDDLVVACKAMDAKAADATDDTEDDADDEVANPYEGKTAQELFKECKKRGVKVEPKKPAKYYVDALTKADAADSEGGEDWDEEEKPAEKKETKGKPAAGKGKTDKKEKPAADAEDWDI